MHSAIGTVADAARQLDWAQACHALAALVALFFGRKCPASLRLVVWGGTAAIFAAVGAAGFYWGEPGLPTLLSAAKVDPYLFAPVPGLIELTTADHVVQLFLGGVFAAAAALTALKPALVSRRTRLAAPLRASWRLRPRGRARPGSEAASLP